MKVWLLACLIVVLTSCSSMPANSSGVSAHAKQVDGVVVIVRYAAQPGKEGQALGAISKLVDTVVATEPETGGITILQDESDKTKITLIEHWPSRAAFLGPHMQKPHIQQFINDSHAFLAGPPDISFWKPASGQ